MLVARPSLLRAIGTALRASGLAPRMVPRLSRSVQTQRLTAYDQQKILNAQRALRPESPHLEIYQPQLTWYLSALHRVTGVAGAGILYLGALAYAFHPLYPVIDSAHAIEFIHNLPYWVKTAGKVALAAPVTFHSFNGIRHLMWDTGKGLTMKGVYTSGYVVLAATAISTIYLSFFV